MLVGLQQDANDLVFVPKDARLQANKTETANEQDSQIQAWYYTVPTACQIAQVKKQSPICLANIINNHLSAVALQATRYEVLVSMTLDKIRRKLIPYIETRG